MWRLEERSRFSGKLRIHALLLASLIKSRSLVYGFAIASFGTFLIATHAQFTDIFIPIKLLILVYMIALATYVYNDLTDITIDKTNNRKIFYKSRSDLYSITRNYTIAFFILSDLIAFSINMQTGIADLCAIILAIAYSHPKTHLKDRFILKTLITGSGGFIASLMGAIAVGNVPPLAYVSSLTVFFFYFLLGPLGDITDMKGDREAKRRTIPLVIGVPKSFLLMMSVVIGIASMIFLSYYALGMNIVAMMLGLIICTYVIIQIKNVSKDFLNKEKINKARTTLRLSFFGIQITLMLGILLNSLNQ